jgi:hypothetical protein
MAASAAATTRPEVTEDDLPDFTFQVGEEGRAGQRAEEGTRFLTVRGDVQSDDGGHRCPGSDDVRISVDGIQVDAAVPRVDLPECFIGGAVSGTWVFVIPATGKAGELHFGMYSEPGTPSGSFTFPRLP